MTTSLCSVRGLIHAVTQLSVSTLDDFASCKREFSPFTHCFLYYYCCEMVHYTQSEFHRRLLCHVNTQSLIGDIFKIHLRPCDSIVAGLAQWAVWLRAAGQGSRLTSVLSACVLFKGTVQSNIVQVQNMKLVMVLRP